MSWRLSDSGGVLNGFGLGGWGAAVLRPYMTRVVGKRCTRVIVPLSLFFA
jgi:hypothetical protein